MCPGLPIGLFFLSQSFHYIFIERKIICQITVLQGFEVHVKDVFGKNAALEQMFMEQIPFDFFNSIQFNDFIISFVKSCSGFLAYQQISLINQVIEYLVAQVTGITDA